MRAVAPDPELIEWLWSYEGIRWHDYVYKRVRHGGGIFAEIKHDHECGQDDLSAYCDLALSGSAGGMEISTIKGDLRRYGISGVPVEWKLRFAVLHHKHTQYPHDLHKISTWNRSATWLHRLYTRQSLWTML